MQKRKQLVGAKRKMVVEEELKIDDDEQNRQRMVIS